MAEYRERLAELDEQSAEAEAWSDLGRRDQVEAERQALLDQLRITTGLGGRKRGFINPAERARKAVSARIRDSIARIRGPHAELGQHLDDTISTGTTCLYQPAQPLRWKVSSDG